MSPPDSPRRAAPCPSQQELVAFNGGVLPTVLRKLAGVEK